MSKRTAEHEPESGAPPESTDAHRAVRSLVDSLSSMESGRVEGTLTQLGIGGESALYHQVGRLARGLHDALHQFQRSLSADEVGMHSTNLADAATKLNKVITLTEEAAQKTLSLTDEQGALLSESRQIVSAIIGDTPADSPQLERLAQLQERLNRIGETSTDIALSQEFQDLCGQMLKKVLKLVVGLEKNLVSLLALFSPPSPPAKDGATTAPPPSEEMAQDDVDSLLKNLGF